VILSGQLPRLLSDTPGNPRSLAEHEEIFQGTKSGRSSLEELEASGLTGRGGAAFPTGKKARLIFEQRGHNKVVVVNAMEGEPASHKDSILVSTNPHLVLDGAEVLASAIGAKDIVICVARDNPTSIAHMQRALAERAPRRNRGPNFDLQTPPWRYVAGEESALVHWLDDHESLPQYRPQRPHILKLNHRPVLVDNAETCANAGLIGRFGAEWFRSIGTDASPGTTLVSLTGAVTRPVVLEAVLGTPLRTILEAAGATPDPQAVLLGGYGGTWLDGSRLDIPYANESLNAVGASVGAGIIVVLGREGCGVTETHRVVEWMANESARQCGPCAFGLPALADDLSQLRRGGAEGDLTLERLVARCGAIAGRGACHHPDGVVRLVRTALEVFRDDFIAHSERRPCAASRSSSYFVSVPALEHESELVWE
jgi:NADH:ubiquinone oxidoreductase subunit F (NADH-binding)